jgi:antitoxin HigA-1
VGWWLRIRTIATRYSAALACRLPPRLSRKRLVLPLNAGRGHTPKSLASAASERIRVGSSPTRMSISAAVIVAIPYDASKVGARIATSCSSTLSCAWISSCSVSQRWANARKAVLADAIVEVIAPGLSALPRPKGFHSTSSSHSLWPKSLAHPMNAPSSPNARQTQTLMRCVGLLAGKVASRRGRGMRWQTPVREKRCPTHPGELLKEDFLPALRLPVAEAARQLGVSRQTLYKIIAGTSPVTPEMAVRLGKWCGNGPGLWLRMQQAFDLWHAERALGPVLAGIVSHKVG